MSRRLVHIELLGGFSLSYGTMSVASLPRAATSLLSYLVVHRSRAQTRDLLAGRFWSDLPEDKARKRLSNALWQMRKVLAEANLGDFIVTTSTTVQIHPEFELDVDSERFEHELDIIEENIRRGRAQGDAADNLSIVLERFPGQFLEGFYDDWIDSERSRINSRYLSGLQQLTRLYKARSDYESALRVARLLVTHDELDEENHREVMRTCALVGDGAAAERHYESCRQILWDQLKVEPSEETERLIARIRADAPAVAEPSPSEAGSSSVAMVGRAKERSVLLSRADDLHAGFGGLVMIEGDAGIGKSRLIDDFIEGVEWRRLRVLSARHTPLSPMRPYDGLREALEPATVGLRAEHLAEILDPVWVQQASAVLPELASQSRAQEQRSALRPSEELSRMSEALARVVLAQGALGPTVIVLEDVHWCDQDSFDVLRHLGTRLAQAAVLVVLTYRRFEAEQSEPVWSSLAKLDTQPSSTRLMLQPLNLFELQDLISGHHGHGALTAAAAGQLLEKTGGNPLFTLESFRASPKMRPASAAESGSLLGGDQKQQDALSLSDELPASLEAVLGQRLQSLDPVVKSVVYAASGCSERFDAAMLTEITGLSKTAVLEAMSAAVEARFIAELENGFCRFSHEHSRQLVYGGLSAQERRQLHGRIYRLLEDAADVRVEQLAYHACLAERWDRGYAWHVEAADDALAMNAFRTAAENFAKADLAAGEAGLDLIDIAPALLRYEAALDVLGERSDQELLIKRLAGEALPLDLELQLAERRCWYLANTDEPAEAIRLAMASAKRATSNGLSPFSFLTIAGTAMMWSGDARGAIEPLSEVLKRCDVASDRLAAETMLGKAYVDLFDLEPAAQHLSNALKTARDLGDVRAQIETLGHSAVLDWHHGRYQQAERTLVESLGLSESIGYRHGEGLNLVNLATLNGTVGRGGRALQYFHRATEVFSAHGSRRGEAIAQVNLAELHHLLLGNDDHAAMLANSAAVYFRSTKNVRIETLALCLTASIDARNGRSRRAWQRMVRVMDRAIKAGDEVSQLEIRSLLGTIEMANERYEESIEHLDRTLAFAQAHNVDSIVPIALARKSWALVNLSQFDQAAACAAQAVELNVAGSRQPHITAWLCGRTFEACGFEELASEHFQNAYERLTASLEGVDDELVDRSWSDVAEHEAIQVAYESRFEKYREVSLPRIDAPMGKPLRPQDYVTVRWIVSAPSDWVEVNAAERRRARLIRLADSAITQGGVVRVADLADVLGVSDRTVKRDLVVLRETGREIRTRKGETAAGLSD